MPKRLLRVFLVIPAYNEHLRLPKVLNKSLRFIKPSEIVVVDDGSSTPLTVAKGVWLLRHPINLGKGSAMKTGAEFAFKDGADAIIFMDADGQHDPKELPMFVEYLTRNYDVVFGSRRPSIDTPTIKFLGSKLSSFILSVMFHIYISDVPSGFRALSKKAFKLLSWESDRYGVETEIVARLGKNKQSLKWIEFPVDTIYMDKYKGFTIIEAIKILPEVIWWKLS